MTLHQLFEQIKYIIRKKEYDSVEALIEIADLIKEFEKSETYSLLQFHHFV